MRCPDKATTRFLLVSVLIFIRKALVFILFQPFNEALCAHFYSFTSVADVDASLWRAVLYGLMMLFVCCSSIFA